METKIWCKLVYNYLTLLYNLKDGKETVKDPV